MPRVRDGHPYRSRRRPHINPSCESHALICYCHSCDEKVERDLPFRLSEYCDCDQYTRWICLPCKVKEDQPEGHYYRTRTKSGFEYDKKGLQHDDGMWLDDHQDVRAVSYSFGVDFSSYVWCWIADGSSSGVRVVRGRRKMAMFDVPGVVEDTILVRGGAKTLLIYLFSIM
jgi:hypothetical protein